MYQCHVFGRSSIIFMRELRVTHHMSTIPIISTIFFFLILKHELKKAITIFCECFSGVNWEYVVKSIGFSNIESSLQCFFFVDNQIRNFFDHLSFYCQFIMTWIDNIEYHLRKKHVFHITFFRVGVQ